MQRQQRRAHQRGRQIEHRGLADIRSDGPHGRGGGAAPDRGIARVAAEPLTQRRPADQMQADGGDSGAEHATGEPVQDFRRQHDRLGRLHGEQQGRGRHGHAGHEGRRALVLQRIDHGAARKLADHGRHRADAEHQADIPLRPGLRRQIDRDEGAEARLHAGDQAVEGVQRQACRDDGALGRGAHCFGGGAATVTGGSAGLAGRL